MCYHQIVVSVSVTADVLPSDCGICHCSSRCDVNASRLQLSCCSLPSDDGICQCNSRCDVNPGRLQLSCCSLPSDDGICQCNSRCDVNTSRLQLSCCTLPSVDDSQCNSRCTLRCPSASQGRPDVFHACVAPFPNEIVC